MKKLFLLLLLINFSHSIYSQCTTGNCEDGYGEQNYREGKYSGYFSNGSRNGKGIYTWPNGQKYAGDFKDGLYHGYGVFQRGSGEIYEGEFKYDKKHGLGTDYNADGTVSFAGQYNEGTKIPTSSSLPKDILADKYLLEAKGLMESNTH